MSAELLRRAAALMCERAESATPVPWEMFADRCVRHPYDGSPDAGMIMWDDSCQENPRGLADGEHIASWHPAVALAVADWLDMVADYIDLLLDGRHPGWRATKHHALAVARAYLGEAADD